MMAVPPKVDGLLDLLVDFPLGEDIGVGGARLAVEGAEPAARDADVGVVDVAVDDVGGPVAGDEALAHFVGSRPHSEQVARAQQVEGFLVGHAGHEAAPGEPAPSAPRSAGAASPPAPPDAQLPPATSSMNRSRGTSSNSPASWASW